MTTARTIVSNALQRLGINAAGETPSAEDAALCFELLNTMLDGWATESMFAHAQAWVVFALPANTTTRTIGPGAQVDVARPIRVEEGSFCRFSNIDYPLTPIGAEKYGDIGLKTITGAWPAFVHYQPTVPTGTLNFWPATSGDVTVHLNTQVIVSQFANLDQDYTLPPGVKRAIELSLVEEIAVPFGRSVPARMEKQAASARANVKRVNLRVPQLDMSMHQRTRLGDFIGGGFDR